MPKQFSASFYQANLSNDVAPDLAADLLGPIVGNGGRVISMGRYHYRAEIVRMAPGCYKGELKRYGEDDLPHAGTPDGVERELHLDAEEKTIERNFFLYFQNRKLLVWQENRRASSAASFGRYLTTVLGETIAFSPVMTPEATRQLILGNYRPKAIQFSVARPLNPEMYANAGEANQVLRIIAGLNGMTGSFRISANAPGIRGRFLNAVSALGLGQQLVASGQASAVRIEMEGLAHPIDLISDRLKDKIHVDMAGRYPYGPSVYHELQVVKDRFEPVLRELFG